MQIIFLNIYTELKKKRKNDKKLRGLKKKNYVKHLNLEIKTRRLKYLH